MLQFSNIVFCIMKKNGKKTTLFCQKKTPERYSPGGIQLRLSPILVTRSVDRVI